MNKAQLKERKRGNHYRHLYEETLKENEALKCCGNCDNVVNDEDYWLACMYGSRYDMVKQTDKCEHWQKID